MTMQIKKEDIPDTLRLLAEAIEHGYIEVTMGLVEEWYNCPSPDGEAKLSVIYKAKRRPMGERQC